MSREHRYQAWSEEHKTMWPVGTIDFVNNVCYVITDFGCHLELPISVMREYTGLKDCNGTEIYEGDIVGHRHISQGGVRSEIRFHNGGYFFFPNWSGMSWGELSRIEHSCEVIGNIYENPELLEGE